MRKSTWLILGLPVGIATFPPPARAVPAWARRTGLECASCHFGGASRLNQRGRDFQLRGHRLRGEVGDAPWRNVTDYLSVSSKLRYTGSGTSPTSDVAVESVSLLTGGPLRGGFSYFAEYGLRNRSATRANPGGTADAYLQYNTAPTEDRYWWARAGRLFPFAIFSAGAGGRTTLSRPRAIGDPLGGGLLYSPRRRSYGVSGGYVAERFRVEAGVVDGGDSPASALSLDRRDVFITVEEDLDAYGSGVGIYGYRGGNRREPLSRLGVLGQYVRDSFTLSGAYFGGRMRDASGGSRSPSSYYGEMAHNFHPEVTGFLRYDYLDNRLGGAGRSRGLVFGVSARLPDRGRAVIEFSRESGGLPRRPPVVFDFNWLY